jgi:DNA polymerase III epsilon subunit-like protein
MDSLVALDIETTGLSAENDAIIEIAAVRFNDRRVEG